jgi:hypothetical protein
MLCERVELGLRLKIDRRIALYVSGLGTTSSSVCPVKLHAEFTSDTCEKA